MLYLQKQSALKRLKTWLRYSMSDKILTDLALLQTHRDFFMV